MASFSRTKSCSPVTRFEQLEAHVETDLDHLEQRNEGARADDRERRALVHQEAAARGAEEAVDHPVAALVGVTVGEVAGEARLLPVRHRALGAGEPRVDRSPQPGLVRRPLVRGQHVVGELLERALERGDEACTGRSVAGSPSSVAHACAWFAARNPSAGSGEQGARSNGASLAIREASPTFCLAPAHGRGALRRRRRASRRRSPVLPPSWSKSPRSAPAAAGAVAVGPPVAAAPRGSVDPPLTASPPSVAPSQPAAPLAPAASAARPAPPPHHPPRRCLSPQSRARSHAQT